MNPNYSLKPGTGHGKFSVLQYCEQNYVCSSLWLL